MRFAVACLTVYPIKSLGGVDFESAEVQSRGLALDRRWMLVDEDGVFISQREDTSLVRFELCAEDDCLVVSSPTSSVQVPFRSDGPGIGVRVWQSELEAPLVSAEVDAWFSSELGRPCHLVSMPDNCPRKISLQFGDASVSFADAMPILVLSESSLGDLNSRLERPVPIDRFRANVVLRDSEAFAEDGWSEISIGNVTLRSTKRCGRCLVTCTDQATGERGTEPLRTLSGYRLFGQNACMGMYYVPSSTGVLRVGDEGHGG